MRKMQTNRPDSDSLNDDPVQWESWLSPEINWGNPLSQLSKSSPDDEPETIMSQQNMFRDQLKFEASDPTHPDQINHGKDQSGSLLTKYSSLKPFLNSITTVQSPPSSSVSLPESRVEESTSQCKIQSESPRSTPELLNDIFSSPGSNMGNDTQICEASDLGDLITFFSANRERCRLASVALPTGVRKKTQKRQAQIRKVSPTAELWEAIEAESLGRDSGVSFGPPILEGTDSKPDLQGAPTVDNQVTTLIRSLKAATGESLTVSQAEDVKKACDKQFGSDNLLEFFSVLDQHPPPPRITPPEFVSSRAACVAYYKELLAPKSDQLSPADNINCRMTQIWLHLFFEDFVKELKEGEKDGSLLFVRNKRQISTVARDFILNDIYGDDFQIQQKDRSALHNETRWGDRWWRIASCNGLGVLLFVNGDLADNMCVCLFHDAHEKIKYSDMIYRGKRTRFLVAMVDALAIYILNTYPGLVCLFRSFQPITLSLMFGRGLPHLSERDSMALLDLLSKPDLRIQKYPNTWQELDAKMASVSTASDLMRIQRGHSQLRLRAA